MNNNVSSLLVLGTVLFFSVLFIIFKDDLLNSDTNESLVDLVNNNDKKTFSDLPPSDQLSKSIEEMKEDEIWSEANYEYIKESIQNAKIDANESADLLGYLEVTYFDLLKNAAEDFIDNPNNSIYDFDPIYDNLKYFYGQSDYSSQMKELMNNYQDFDMLKTLEKDISHTIADGMSELEIRIYLSELKKLYRNAKLKTRPDYSSGISRLRNKLIDALFEAVNRDLENYLKQQYQADKCEYFDDKLRKTILKDEYLKNYSGIDEFLMEGKEDLKTQKGYEEGISNAVRWEVIQEKKPCESVFGKFTFYVNLCKEKSNSLNQK